MGLAAAAAAGYTRHGAAWGGPSRPLPHCGRRAWRSHVHSMRSASCSRWPRGRRPFFSPPARPTGTGRLRGACGRRRGPRPCAYGVGAAAGRSRHPGRLPRQPSRPSANAAVRPLCTKPGTYHHSIYLHIILSSIMIFVYCKSDLLYIVQLKVLSYGILFTCLMSSGLPYRRARRPPFHLQEHVCVSPYIVISTTN